MSGRESVKPGGTAGKIIILSQQTLLGTGFFISFSPSVFHQKYFFTKKGNAS